MTAVPSRDIRGVLIFDTYLNRVEQAALADDVRAIVRAAPLVTPMTRRGPMSVQMTSAGRFGWIADRSGYRYEACPTHDRHWPPIPECLLNIWRFVAPQARVPECCLVNWYAPGARMGMHQDRDEADFDQPVVSVSLGDDALFRIGNRSRGGQTESVWLRSGDVMVMGGAARLLHHGVDRIAEGTSTLLDRPGRINLTMRVVTADENS